ncbi:spaetzle-processing enzyme-like [Chironomus tepperi]|uniref:spaetzle-processing enzyme-like n=1 Tax=Chironomus tepperi TaxID=113505 RepID=UPI00391EEEAA
MIKCLLVLLLLNIACGYEFQNATQLESPWYVYLTVLGEPCGGSLIKNKYVVTAAHCFNKVKKDHYTNEDGKLEAAVKLKLGIWKTDRNPDCEPGVDDQICEYHVEIPPNELKVHRRYNPNSGRERFKNDIAIIELTWPPRQSELVRSIELPESGDCEEDFEDDVWTVTGFGLSTNQDYATTKKKIDLRMISKEECEDGLGDARQYYDKRTHICGKGRKGETTCAGDSGSGVIERTSTGPILQGIVSFGVSKCGTAGAPSGFVKVACFKEWIKETIDEFKIDPSKYASPVFKPKMLTKGKKQKSNTDSGVYGLFKMFGYFY